jgi:hypothetical protein
MVPGDRDRFPAASWVPAGDSTMVRASAVSGLLLALLPFTLLAQGPEAKTRSLAKPASYEYNTPFLINSLFAHVSNNGSGAYNYWNTTIPGEEFPKGSGRCVVFIHGIIWGGLHDGKAPAKIGGSEYRHSVRPGKILVAGTPASLPVPDDSALAKYRVYRVRPDIRPGLARTAAMDAELNEEAALIVRFRAVTPQEIYDGYMRDWNEWPAADGAPFDDRNGDGHYDPAIDVPGIKSADQTLWYVCNDADPWMSSRVASSPPIGIEMQTTVWGYRRSGPLSSTYFVRNRIINMSGMPVDSMYIGKWADPDVGDALDDVVGYDRNLAMGFAYNGKANDKVYGYAVPATGFVVLSGPAVAGALTDSAIVDLQVRRGRRSLDPSAFTMSNGGGYPEYADPGDYRSWYCQLKGLSPYGCAPLFDPTTGQPATLYATGDPVLGTGWLDGVTILPSDRRCMISMGPFTFAPGDTQEIVVAHCVAQASDRISSVRVLKESAQDIRRMYADLLRPAPSATVVVEYPDPSVAQIAVRVDARTVPVRAPRAILITDGGASITGISLDDNGLHGDGAALDSVYRGTTIVQASLTPARVDLEFTDAQGVSRRSVLESRLTIAGDLAVTGPVVFSENLLPDGKANPGENIRFGVQLANHTGFTLGRLTLRHLHGPSVAPLVASVPSGGTWSNVYSAGDHASYLFLEVPALLSGSTFGLPVVVADSAGNEWQDTLAFAAAPSRYVPSLDTAVARRGVSEGTFGIMIVDRRALRSHRYVLHAEAPVSPGGPVTYTLEDSTDGRLLFDRHEVPDSLGHTMPLTDGFKIVRGSVVSPGGQMRGWSSSGTGRMWTSAPQTGLGLEGFNTDIGNAFDHWPSGGVGYDRHRNIVVAFAAADSSGKVLTPSGSHCSIAHRYLQNADKPAAVPVFAPYIVKSGPGYQYQDYTTLVPFAAFDVDTIPPRRLMVGYLENNVAAGTVDGRYWPPSSGPYGTTDNTSDTSAREWFFIFDLPYGTAPAPQLQVDLATAWTPMMWLGSPTRRAARLVPLETDTFLIHTRLSPRHGDRWSFDPIASAGGLDATIPSAFEVFPNYPNPFNAGTTIKLALPADGRIIVRIYNILGQEVRLLADGEMPEGYRSVYWDGRNDREEQVGSGVYLYRVESMQSGVPTSVAVRVGKMIMLR